MDVAILRASMTFARSAWEPNVSLVLSYSLIFLSGRIHFRRTPINLGCVKTDHLDQFPNPHVL